MKQELEYGGDMKPTIAIQCRNGNFYFDFFINNILVGGYGLLMEKNAKLLYEMLGINIYKFFEKDIEHFFDNELQKRINHYNEWPNEERKKFQTKKENIDKWIKKQVKNNGKI